MRFPRIVFAAALTAIAGCAVFDGLVEKIHPESPATFSQYHLYVWSWDSVSRVVALPFLNESDFTRAGDEIHGAFTSEFQRLGRFEVVGLRGDENVALAKHIHVNGTFDEAVMFDLAAHTRADVVIFGIVTQYSPYPRPRMGLILQAVSPAQAKVVASVDGLWDTTDKRISNRLRAFYRQKPHERLPWYRNFVPQTDDAFAAELALESPALFQRFVCHEASLALMGFPVPGVECPTPPPLSGLPQPYPYLVSESGPVPPPPVKAAVPGDSNAKKQ